MHSVGGCWGLWDRNDPGYQREEANEWCRNNWRSSGAINGLRKTFNFWFLKISFSYETKSRLIVQDKNDKKINQQRKMQISSRTKKFKTSEFHTKYLKTGKKYSECWKSWSALLIIITPITAPWVEVSPLKIAERYINLRWKWIKSVRFALNAMKAVKKNTFKHRKIFSTT